MLNVIVSNVQCVHIALCVIVWVMVGFVGIVFFRN